MYSELTPHAEGRSSATKTEIKSAIVLERDLRKAIRGEVRFDDGSRALYSTDSSNYRQAPIGVVIPRNKEDVEITVALCRKHGIPITGRGGGTSLAGQCCNVSVIIDFSKYMYHLVELNPERKLARVQPGMIYDDLNRATAHHQLAFGPDPSTHSHCTSAA